MGTYSTAAEAASKKKIDAAILGAAAAAAGPDIADESYLRALLKSVSGDPAVISPSARGLQFFIVKGGGEGLLPPEYAKLDASRVISGSSVSHDLMVFDDNDLIVAFDARGKFISAALLRRPIQIDYWQPGDKLNWREVTAEKTYNAWDGQPVTLYLNRNFGVQYYGLRVDDKLGLYRTGQVQIDIHKDEGTRGCIMIVDDKTPSNRSALQSFEPEFIVKVQSAVKAKTGYNIGIMRMFKV